MPQMPTRSPGRRAPRRVSAANGVATASKAMAACSIGTPSGTGATVNHGTAMYSAQAPS